MKHFHFGAGHFGLGFGVYTFFKAGLRTIIFNRPSSRTVAVGEDTITRHERNQMLARSNSFIVDCDVYSPTSLQLDTEIVEYESFHEYRDQDDFASFTTQGMETWLVTASLGNVKAYADVLTLIRMRRNFTDAPIYVLPLENAIDKAGIAAAFPIFTQLNNVFLLDCSVDRMCTSFTKTNGNRLIVMCEKYLALCVEQPKDDGFFARVLGATPYVKISNQIAFEKQKKFMILNGSHALIASLAAYHRFGEIHLFMSEERTKSSANLLTLDERRTAAKNILSEMGEAYQFWIRENSQELKNTELDAEIRDYIEAILKRISTTRDTSKRVLRRLLTPKAQSDGTYSNTPMEFYGWLQPRLLPALELYVRHKGILPREVCMTLAKMFEMLGNARFIDSRAIEPSIH
jgi:hypothetical protein